MSLNTTQTWDLTYPDAGSIQKSAKTLAIEIFGKAIESIAKGITKAFMS